MENTKQELRLLKVLEDRMYLYFYGKNINNIKFKYNTKKMIVLNRLPFLKGQHGIDNRILNKIARRRKLSKIHLKKFKTKSISSVFFTTKQKWKLVRRIFRNVKKAPICYTLFFKVHEDIYKVNLKKDVFIVSFYSEKAALKKLLLALDYVFEEYQEFKTVFVTTVEFHYWYEELHVDVSFKWNRVKITVGLTSKYKTALQLLKNLYIQRRFKAIEDEEYERSVFWYKV
jgi:hypothetical protein